MDVDGGVLSPYSFLVLPRQNTAGGGGGGGGGPGSSNGTSPSSTATTGLGNGNNGGPQQTAPPQPSGTDQGGPPQQQNQSAGGTPLSVFVSETDGQYRYLARTIQEHPASRSLIPEQPRSSKVVSRVAIFLTLPRWLFARPLPHCRLLSLVSLALHSKTDLRDSSMI